MKKYVISLLLSIILILTCTLNVHASTATRKLTPSSKEVKQGETFSVTLTVTCADGINGLTDINLSYDEKNLELTQSSVKDSNFISLSSDTIMSNSENKITSSNIYVFNFKVKADAKVGDKAKIQLGAMTLDSDASQDSSVKLDAISTEVTIISSTTEEDTKKDEEKPATDDTKKDEEKPATEDTKKDEEKPATDDTKKEEEKTSTDSTKNDKTEETKKTQIKTTPTNTTTTTKKDTTQSPKELSKTGIYTGIGFITLGIIIIGIISYLKYSKYKDIK